MWEAHEEYDDYFLWLCGIINLDFDRYSTLIYILQDMDFVWVLDRDSGRSSDGLALREEYYHQTFDDWVMLWEKSCTVLEALIGLARTMDAMLIDENTSDRTRVWFWEFIRNLGLKKYTNQYIETLFVEEREFDIQSIVMVWMNRDFDVDGTGSVFPLKNPRRDQREETMIYQLNSYILENYAFDE